VLHPLVAGSVVNWFCKMDWLGCNICQCKT